MALILSTGVIVQARWQHQGPQLNDDLEVIGDISACLTCFFFLNSVMFKVYEGYLRAVNDS